VRILVINNRAKEMSDILGVGHSLTGMGCPLRAQETLVFSTIRPEACRGREEGAFLCREPGNPSLFHLAERFDEARGAGIAIRGACGGWTNSFNSAEKKRRLKNDECQGGSPRG